MYEVAVTNRGSLVFEVDSIDYKFSIDTKDAGISPPATLLASLGSCIRVYMRKYCEGAHILCDNFTIRVSAEFTKEKPVAFRQINLSIDLESTQMPERWRKSLLEFIKKCPINNTLSINPAINIKIS